MAKIEVRSGSRLDGMAIHEIEDELDVSIVLLVTDGQLDIEPPPDHILKPGESFSLVSTLSEITTLSNTWNRSR